MGEQEKSKLSRPKLCAIIGAMKKRQLKKEDPIAIMDSGLGGISVLRQMKKVMPLEDYLYFGDSVHAPYGERPQEEIIALCEENTEMLLERGAKCIVIACNTATSAAAEVLRSRYPEIPVIGMEPAVKPAAKSGGHPKVLVLATPITIRGDRLHHLVENFDGEADFTLLEAPGIVRFVEAGICDANPEEPLMEYLRELLSPYSMQADGRIPEHVDGVVLGCTHFPFVKESIGRTLGYPIHIFDGAKGTALWTRKRLSDLGLLREENPHPGIELMNSDREKLPTARLLLSLPMEETEES